MIRFTTILLLLLTSNFAISKPKKEAEIRYFQFKHEFSNLDLNPQPRRRSYSYSKPDKMPLFIAGGLIIVSGALIFTTNENNYTQDKSAVTTGIAIGGLTMSGLFIAKYFIDKGNQ